MIVFVWVLALLAAFILPGALQQWLGIPLALFDGNLAQYLFSGLVVALVFTGSQWWRSRKHPWRPTGLPLFLVGFVGVAGVLLLTSLSGLINLPPQGQAARMALVLIAGIAIAFAVNACYDLEKRRLRLWLALLFSRRHGRRDGDEGIPSSKVDGDARHLGVLKNRGELAGSTIGGEFVASDNRIRREYRDAHHQHIELRAELNQLEAYADEDRLHKSKATIAPRWYFFALCLLVVSEFPLNTIAFAILEEPPLQTAIMTLSLAVTLLACAHGLGAALHDPKDPRERENARPEFAPSIKKWIAVLIVVPVVACFAVALVRFFFLSAEGSVVSQQNLPFIAIAFLVINLLIYTAGTMLSWLYHNPFAENARRMQVQRGRMEVARSEVQSNFQEHTARYEGEKNYWQTLYAAYAQENERARQGESHASFSTEAILDDPGPLNKETKQEIDVLAAKWDAELDRWDDELLERGIPGARLMEHSGDASGNGERRGNSRTGVPAK